MDTGRRGVSLGCLWRKTEGECCKKEEGGKVKGRRAGGKEDKKGGVSGHAQAQCFFLRKRRGERHWEKEGRKKGKYFASHPGFITMSI